MMGVRPKPLDVYSVDRTVPFDIAAYCRGHKFSIEAVNLRRAIEAKQTALNNVESAERALARADDMMQACIDSVREKMKKDPT